MLAREEMLRKLHVRDEYYRRRARRSFAEFLRYTKPDYHLSWFHEELASELDRFIEDVLLLRSPRLIINVPPQEGKSEQVSRRFPSYALGRDPNLRVVACSYSATLALQFSRDAPAAEAAYKKAIALRPNYVVQGNPGNILGYKEVNIPLMTVIEGDADIWMVELRNRLGFCVKPPAGCFIGDCACGQDFYSDIAIQ